MTRTVVLLLAIASVALIGCDEGDSGESASRTVSSTAPVTAVVPPKSSTGGRGEPSTNSSVQTTTTPSATDTPDTTDVPETTTPPAASAGTRGNPVPLGQPADVGEGWIAVVNSVNLNANDQVAAENQFNDPPADGKVFVLANVTITYNGSEPSDSGGVNFEAVGAATNTAIGTGSGTIAVAPDALQTFTEVFQGGSLTGNVLLEVPIADVDTLVLIGHAFASFDDDERAFFATR